MKWKKIRMKGLTILGLLVCASLVSASTLSVPIKKVDNLGNTIITSYNDVYGRLVNLLKNRLAFTLPWLLLNKGTNTYKLNSFSSWKILCLIIKDGAFFFKAL